MAENVIVDGIGIFEKTFSEFKDSFVIIGGAACRATLSDGRYTPRKTKDIDMVLVLDRLEKKRTVTKCHKKTERYAML